MENLKSQNKEIIDISLIQNLSSQELVSIAKNLSVQELKPIMIIEKYYEDSSLYSFYSKTLTYANMEDLLVDSSPKARKQIEDFFIYCLKNYKLFWLRKNILDKNYETLNELQDLENINDINYNFADGKTKKIISLGLNPLNMDFGSGVSSWFNGSGTEITVINKEQNKTLIETIYNENLEIPAETIFICKDMHIDEYISFLILKNEIILNEETKNYIIQLVKNNNLDSPDYQDLLSLVKNNNKEEIIELLNSKKKTLT